MTHGSDGYSQFSPETHKAALEAAHLVQRGEIPDSERLQALAEFALDAMPEIQRLGELAMFDELTELPNRRAYNLNVKRIFADAERSNRSVMLAFCDLNLFKAINDVLGHNAGDALLKETAIAIGQTVRDGDEAYRWAGDEFVILGGVEKSKLVSEEHCQGVEARIEKGVTERVRGTSAYQKLFPDTGLKFGITVGIATTGFTETHEPIITPVQLLEVADQRMKAKKEKSRLADRSDLRL